MDENLKIELEGLTKAEALDLQEALGDDVTVAPKSVQASRYGVADPITAGVAISIAAITALAAWLVKRRKRGRISYIMSFETASGDRKTEAFQIETLDEQSDAKVLTALLSRLGTSLDQLA